MAVDERIEKLYKIISDSDNIVFFGGAGVSTESGIPDFRSQDGLYMMKYKYPPETIVSHTFFREKTEEFYEFYRDKMIYEDAKPNITHYFLAKLEQIGKLKAVVTQNIDGLHQAAGSKNVIELHGSTLRNYCMSCGKKYGLDAVLKTSGVPKCECGGIIRPDVVLYEEQLSEVDIERAITAIENADVLIIGGTSLSVYPAAGFIRGFSGSSLVLINKSATSYDRNADLLINMGLGEVFGELDKRF
jgi:NAD-dependent deacetylase